LLPAATNRIFRSSDGQVWAGVLAEGDLSFLPLHSADFRDFLLQTFFRVYQFFPAPADSVPRKRPITLSPSHPVTHRPSGAFPSHARQ